MRYAAAAALTAGMVFAQQAPVTAQQAPTAQQLPPRLLTRLNDAAQVLELTPAQQTEMRNIIQDAITRAKPVIQQLRANRQALRQALQSGATIQPQQYGAAQGSLLGQLAAIRADAMQRFYGMLNPQQRQRAIALHELVMGRHGEGE